MIFRKNNVQEKIQKKTPLEKLFGMILILFVSIALISAFTIIRKIVVRISSVFYFPFLKLTKAMENEAADAALLLQSRTTLAKALKKMQQEQLALLAEQARLQDTEKQNTELRRLLKIRPRNSFTPVFAQLLYRNEFLSEDVFVIDKGEKDGIAPGNLVTAAVSIPGVSRPFTAVAGRVRSVSAHTSVVASVFSPDFRLSVRLYPTGATGVMTVLPETARPFTGITYLPVNANVKDGMYVLTGSLTDNGPSGILAGRIAAYAQGQDALEKDHVYKVARMRPFALPEEIRFVAVYVRDKREDDEKRDE